MASAEAVFPFCKDNIDRGSVSPMGSLPKDKKSLMATTNNLLWGIFEQKVVMYELQSSYEFSHQLSKMTIDLLLTKKEKGISFFDETISMMDQLIEIFTTEITESFIEEERFDEVTMLYNSLKEKSQSKEASIITDKSLLNNIPDLLTLMLKLEGYENAYYLAKKVLIKKENKEMISQCETKFEELIKLINLKIIQLKKIKDDLIKEKELFLSKINKEIPKAKKESDKAINGLLSILPVIDQLNMAMVKTSSCSFVARFAHKD